MLIYFFKMMFGRLKKLSYLCGMIYNKILKLIHKDLHPLNEAVIRLTRNKWYTFAEGKTSCATGKFRVVRLRSVNGEDVVDVEIKLIKDEPKYKDSTIEQWEKSRNRTIKYYIPKSDLIDRLRLVGIRNYKLGNIKIK